MASLILSRVAASVTELKRNPMGTVKSAGGEAVAILNHNAPAFYCVPAALYGQMLERLEDAELHALADARRSDRVVRVPLDEL